MADINTIIKIKSASGDTYDSLFPTTKSENVLVDGAGKTLKQTLSEIDAAKGAANGFVMADANNKVKTDQIPDIDFATKVVNKPTTVDGYGITDALKITGGTISGYGTIRIINHTPNTQYDVVTKGYVDAIAQGLSNKIAVRAATTENVSLIGPMTVDGVALSTNNRVLVKNQTVASENGIYVVHGNEAWTRAVDFDSETDIPKDTFVFVEEGTKNADSGWVLVTDGEIVLGTTDLQFTQFSGAGTILAGMGLSKNGNEILIANTGVAAGTYTKVTVNEQGQVTGTAALTEDDLPNISWAKITGRPTSTPTQIDNAVTNSHTHTDLTVLNDIAGGSSSITYKGERLALSSEVQSAVVSSSQPTGQTAGSVWYQPV